MALSKDCRRLIQTDWYRTYFPHVILTGDQNAKKRFDNTGGGYRIASSVGGLGTGVGGGHLLIDDPHNIKDVKRKIAREEVVQWWKDVMSSRSNNQKIGTRVAIMQRSHKNDLAATLLEQDFEELRIPLEFVPEKRIFTSIGWTDPRKVKGELMHPDFCGPKEAAEIKRDMGPYNAASQLQQDPENPEGSIIKKVWLHHWDSINVNDFDIIESHWDMATKGKQTSDFTVGQVWGRKGPNFYLLDQVRNRTGFNGMLQMFILLHDRWGGLIKGKYIEDKASGPAVEDQARLILPGVHELPPSGGDKVARLRATEPYWASGNIWLPPLNDPDYPWLADYIKELTDFPDVGNDDQCDATSQAINHLSVYRRGIMAGRLHG